MSHRSRRRKSKPDRVYPIDDDRSGFRIRSDQITREYTGALVHKKDIDEQWPIEEKPNYTNRALPFIRKEAINYTNNNPLAVPGTLYWEDWNTVTWDQWFTKWEDA